MNKKRLTVQLGYEGDMLPRTERHIFDTYLEVEGKAKSVITKALRETDKIKTIAFMISEISEKLHKAETVKQLMTEAGWSVLLHDQYEVYQIVAVTTRDRFLMEVPDEVVQLLCGESVKIIVSETGITINIYK